MAIYGCRVKIVGRSGGHSAVAAAAYRAREEISDARTGQRHDYRKAYGGGDIAFAGIYTPKDAPEWARERSSLWNAVEAFEKRKDSQLAREFQVDLPHELSEEQNRYLVQDWVKSNFTRKGYAADVAIHRAHDWGDERNVHAHILVTTRKIDADGFAPMKDEATNSKAQLAAWRESWANHLAHHLDRHGFTEEAERMQVGHLTLAKQREAAIGRGDTEWADALHREPTIHLGKDAAAMERRGLETDKGDINRAIVSSAWLEREEQPVPAPSLNLPAIHLHREAFRESLAERAAEQGAMEPANAALEGLPRDLQRAAGHVEHGLSGVAQVGESVAGAVEGLAIGLERFLFGAGQGAAPAMPRAAAPEQKTEGDKVREQVGRLEPQVRTADPNIPRYHFGVDPELVAEIRRRREVREREEDRDRGRDRDR